MKPVKTEKTNCTLKGGPGILDLPVTQYKGDGDIPYVESCWELSDKELEEVVKTKKIYFTCMGQTHPPILLSSTSLAEEK